MRQTLAALRMLLVLTLVTGVLYPAVVWVIGRTAFTDNAEGSFVSRDGTVVASTLIGQAFTGPDWFAPRPSAGGYDALASGGSNLGPESQVLRRQVERRIARVAAREGVEPTGVPADAVTASASGLDPFISEEYAELQVPRVAANRGVSEGALRALVDEATSGRMFGFLGNPRVNVVELNLALADAEGLDAAATRGGAD